MGRRDGNPTSYTGGVGSWKDVDDESFREAFQKCMDGDDPNKSRSNFTELVVDLTKVSTAWRFNLPTWCSSSSATTLVLCAVRTGANMYELAAPTALFRAMAPKTPRGRQQLQKILMRDEGGVKWKELMELAEAALHTLRRRRAADGSAAAAAEPPWTSTPRRASTGRCPNSSAILDGSARTHPRRRAPGIARAARGCPRHDCQGDARDVCAFCRRTHPRVRSSETLTKARAVKSFFQAIFHAGKKTDEESDSREAFDGVNPPRRTPAR